MVQIQFRPAGKTIDVSRGTLLFDAVRRAGMPIASPCGDDLICAKCGVWIHEGRTAREAPVETDAKRRNRVPSGQRLACAVRVRDDLVVSADYWGEGER